MIETAGGPALTLALLGAAGPQPYERREALLVLIGHVCSNVEFTAKTTQKSISQEVSRLRRRRSEDIAIATQYLWPPLIQGLSADRWKMAWNSASGAF